MKKLFATIVLLSSLQANALVGASLSGGWSTYFYIAGGFVTSSSIYCGIQVDFRRKNSKYCDGLNTNQGYILDFLYGLLLLDDGSKVGTFPELSEEMINSLSLSDDEVNSYTQDLTKLRLTASHISDSANIRSPRDIELAAQRIHEALSGNFSEQTLSVVEAIRSFNSSKR